MKDQIHTVFFDESFIALEFLSPHFSELNSVHPDRGYCDFFSQPVALHIGDHPMDEPLYIVPIQFNKILKKIF